MKRACLFTIVCVGNRVAKTTWGARLQERSAYFLEISGRSVHRGEREFHLGGRA